MAYKIPVEIIELEKDNYHVLVSSVFCDGSTRKWVIDTGASKSVFDKKLELLIERIDGSSEDLHSAGISEEPMKGELASLKTFSFSNLKIKDMKVVALNLDHINKLYSSTAGTEICGLIGGDFLMKYRAVIDYKRKRLLLTTRKR